MAKQKLPTLRGESVTLRRIKRSDMADRARIGKHHEVSHMYGGESMAAPEYAPRRAYRGWYRKTRHEPHSFIIEYAGQGVGVIRLHHFNQTDRSATLAVGIHDPNLHGKGLGTQAIRLLLAYGFESLHLHRIDLKVLEYNTRGIACYEKCGFHKEGVLRESAWIDKAWHSDIIMSILEQEYRTMYHNKNTENTVCQKEDTKL